MLSPERFNLKVTVKREITHPLFIEREEVWDDGENPPVDMHSAYALDGSYIGNFSDADHLCNKIGIKPEKRNVDSNVATIGFCEATQQWYGWSHRAIFGFKVGDIVEKGDVLDGPLPLDFVAKNLDDAKQMASLFAGEVG